MKIIFNLEYQTTFGEELMLNIKKENGETEQYKMTTLDGLHTLTTTIPCSVATRSAATNGWWSLTGWNLPPRRG